MIFGDVAGETRAGRAADGVDQASSGRAAQRDDDAARGVVRRAILGSSSSLIRT